MNSFENASASSVDISRIEKLCQQLYEGSSDAERSEAEAALVPLASSVSNIPQCIFLFSHSSSPYSQLIALSSLTKIISNNFSRLSSEQKQELRDFCLKGLVERGASMQQFVTSECITLLCRITKLGWLEEAALRNIFDEVEPCFNSNEDHCLIGLQIMNRLVIEMNQNVFNSKKIFSYTQHRKICTSFRDQSLLQILNIGRTTLAKLSPSPVHQKLRKLGLDLVASCLSFDFIASSLDEASDDLGSIQVPLSWRTLIEDLSFVDSFLDIYVATCTSDPETSTKALECLSQLAGVRRSLFSSDETRLAFLRSHINGTVQILRNQLGLDNHDNYHQFCRWLARLKSNYQLSEIVGIDIYHDWIGLVSQFTLFSLSSDWEWLGHSLYYLVTLWSRMVAYLPYLKGNSVNQVVKQLEKYVEQFVERYITCRLFSIKNDRSIDDLSEEDEDLFEYHFDMIAIIFRLEYGQTCQYICSILDPFLERYLRYLSVYAQGQTISDPTSIRDMATLEHDLAWLVRIIGATINGRLSASSSDSQELADGELSSRVYQLAINIVKVEQNRSSRISDRYTILYLDEAIIEFTQSFRRVYIGEQAVATSKVYARLSERLGINDNMVVLDIMASKILSNLQRYGTNDGYAVVDKSLQLFSDFASGHSSGRLLGKLSTVRQMLGNHGEDQFPFMKGPDRKMGRNRTLFYHTMARILFTGMGSGEYDSERGFESFMLPIATRLQALMSIHSDEVFLNDSSVSKALTGALRDLRGVISATTIRKTYTLFFDWVYPVYCPLFIKAATIYSAHWPSEVTTPLLKFFSEWVCNRPQRIVFDSSSANGILLFRETSKILVAFGTQSLRQWVRIRQNCSDPYTSFYKNVAVCFQIFTRVLSGNYVNFGVFELYGDPALSDAMQITFQLISAVPMTDLFSYPKLTKAYFGFIEILCSSHTATLVKLEHSVFLHIIQTIQEGLQSLEVWMSTTCASSLDHILEFQFKQTMKNSPEGMEFRAHIEKSPDLFPGCLEILFNAIFQEDCTNQWSLSRPLFSLILTNSEAYMNLKDNIIASQVTPENQKIMKDAFENLMTEVHPNLESRTRDKFTHNVSSFRQAIKQVM